MVEAAVPVVAGIGEVAAGALAGASVFAILAIRSIVNKFYHPTLQDTYNRLIQTYTVLSIDHPGYTEITTEYGWGGQVLQIPKPLTQEFREKVQGMVNEFLATKFTSLVDLRDTLGALSTDQARPYINDATYAKLRSYYQSEYNRLSLPAGAAAVAGATPTLPSAAIIQAAVASIFGGIYAAPSAGVSQPGASAGAATGTAGATATGTLSTPLTSGQDITSALPGILTGALPLVGTSVISGLLANVLSIGNGLHSGALQSQQSAAQKMLDLATSTLPALAGMALLEAPGIRDIITEPISEWMFSHLFTLPEIKKPMTPDQAPEVARALLERAISGAGRPRGIG